MRDPNSRFSGSMFSELERFRREVDNLFNFGLARSSLRSGANTFPAISIGESTEDVRVYAFAPGIDKSSLDITIQGNLLRIAGQRQRPENEHEKPSVTWHRRERSMGNFTRLVELPETVDPNQVNASYQDGVLSIFLGKKAEVKPKKIAVQSV